MSRRVPSLRSTLAVALLVALSLSGAALAAEDSKAAAKVEVEKAALHYKLGRFEEALAAYTRAYELFNAPVLLFNIGQCHKNLKHHERAIFFFQGYLREETNPEKRALAEDLLSRSRADLDRQRLEATPPPTPALALLPTPEPRAVAGASASTAAVTQSASEQRAATPLTRKWWFWTALGVGVAAFAGGTIAYYASGHTITVPPSGSLGTLDRR